MTDAMIEAIALVVVAFSGMRVLYGNWPWEGHKTWYATRRLLRSGEQDQEGISLSPEQIAQAIASAASITNGQLENTKGSEVSGTDGNPLVVIENTKSPEISGTDGNPSVVIENTKSPEISGTDGNPLVVEIIPACGDPTVKQPNPFLEAVVSIQSFIEETGAVRTIDARRNPRAGRSAQR